MIVANQAQVAGLMRNFKKKSAITMHNSPSQKSGLTLERSLGSMLKEAIKTQTQDSESAGAFTDAKLASLKKKPAAVSLRQVLPLEKIKERIPDTEHLARIRALLVAAHSNDAFIKKLSEGNSYVPMNGDPEGSKEMGPSFS